MPFVTSSFLLLVKPGATSSVLALRNALAGELSTRFPPAALLDPHFPSSPRDHLGREVPFLLITV